MKHADLLRLSDDVQAVLDVDKTDRFKHDHSCSNTQSNVHLIILHGSISSHFTIAWRLYFIVFCSFLLCFVMFILSDDWVRVICDILRDYPHTGCLRADIHDTNASFAEALDSISSACLCSCLCILGHVAL